MLAADLAGAKKILREDFAEHPAFQTLFRLPTMPAVTVQMEFSKPVLPYDRTTFGPLTILGSFVEQSRSTFTHVPGRLSIILTPPEKFIPMKEEEIIKEVIAEAYELGLDLESNLLNYRIVSHPEDFYSLEPNNDWMRPNQRTDIQGLVLAGDYTRQPYFSTMEGAVVSGLKASQVIMGES
ncbi:FAD-dependent oxidoreductase [Ornithinibacillus hominis]|uniref:FAD-dependent oxidoreductase n=1 Tax=Ornithinibacillus hominis TaxID=2763055 RepID=UPI00344C30BB